MTDLQKHLLNWYEKNQRPLPWRHNRDPYRVWISETMLQQTTAQAVIPYFARFMAKFPTLDDLAQATIEEVYEHWAGLGYYSRARNLHKAALALAPAPFPQTHQALLQYPGFGPYTARAVASIAFDEPVGVVDGNVIRVLSRLFALAIEWWKPQGRQKFQALADQMVGGVPAHLMNQAMMELGATICTPQSPACFLCPLRADCSALVADRVAELPLRKPRRAMEIWHWQPAVMVRGGRMAFVKNDYAPFLKGQWLLPGTVTRQELKPTSFDFRHCITHHDIYVSVPRKSTLLPTARMRMATWFEIQSLAKQIPFALIAKTLKVFHSRPSPS
jgi:A/G-specific adenine glycosylase